MSRLTAKLWTLALCTRRLIQMRAARNRYQRDATSSALERRKDKFLVYDSLEIDLYWN